MRVAIYIRVSRTDLNLDNQKIALEEFVKQRGWEYEVFEEKESTRKTRPVKEEVLNLLRKGKFNAVVVYKLDRWARSLQELIMNIEELKNKGKGFIVLTQNIDTTTSSGMLMFQILGAFAEFEREMIRERTLAGLDRARAKGVKLGRPWGVSKKNIPTEQGVSILLAQGKTEREIASILESSRYMVQKKIKEIREKNALAEQGGGLPPNEFG